MAAQAVALANVQTYLNRIEQLYAQIRDWMAVLEPNVRFSETVVVLDEGATGGYEAKSLEVVRSGKPALRLVPRGRYMVGAEGRVDVRSRLGRETLVWVREGGPAVGFRFLPGDGPVPEEVRGQAMFPGIAEGWAWVDEAGRSLRHLDLGVFRDRILSSLGSDA